MTVLEDIYGALPVGAQNLALSAFGLHYRRLRLGGRFEEYAVEFREREKWSPDRFHDHCQTRLREILALAYEQTPYYRTTWQAAGIETGDLRGLLLEDLHRLPLTPKEDVRAAPDSFVSQKAKKTSRLLATRTSGSTGTPTTVYVTRDIVRRSVGAREARSYGWAGASIKLPRSTIGARLVVPGVEAKPPFYRYNRAEHQVYLSAFHLSPENVADYVGGLNRYRPQVLTGFAHSHYLLARMMTDARLHLDYTPRAAILGSEKVWPAMRTVIVEALGAPVFEEYGSVEDCALATECEAGHLHVSPDFGIVEVIDDDGCPAAPGRPGRLVCTGLNNYAQPLIRFDIGDVGAWSTERCGCGRDHFPILESILGRQNDAILTTDGRTVIGCDEIFSVAGAITEGQIVQESLDRFTILVVPAGRFDAEQEGRLASELKKRVGEVTVDFKVVSAIERSRSGKFKPVISRVTSPGDGAAHTRWEPLP